MKNTDNREAFYASVRAIDALCPACKQPQNAPSCERREHRLPSDTIRPAVWDGYPSEPERARAMCNHCVEIRRHDIDNCCCICHEQQPVVIDHSIATGNCDCAPQCQKAAAERTVR